MKPPSPRQDLPADASEHSLLPTEPPLILIVEDDRDTLVDLRLRLGASGYRTRFATEGQAAVRTLEETRPDVVLLDLGLPNRGTERVLDSLKSDPQQVPIVALHARDPASCRKLGPMLGIDTYIDQMRNSRALLSAIDTALHEDD